MNQERTVKVTLEGDPLFVEAITDRLKECLDVTWVSKDQHIKLSNHIRRYLRVRPLSAPLPLGRPTGGQSGIGGGPGATS
ncbi:MAG: hypothetical protein BroJett011_04470 [Chloroflexota bacterium]|nr:MAG: hypothetical protein BroJett011_04470 [Chloroflexota bacterium]